MKKTRAESLKPEMGNKVSGTRGERAVGRRKEY